MRTVNGQPAFSYCAISHMQEAERLMDIPESALSQEQFDSAFTEEMLQARAQMAMAHLKLAEMLVDATGSYGC